MNFDARQETVLTAFEARAYLTRLESERALAGASELGGVDAYVADLDEEIGHWRSFYVGAAVTEIASLRGQLSGPLYG